MIHSCQKIRCGSFALRLRRKKNGVQVPLRICRGIWTPLSVTSTGPPLGAMRYGNTLSKRHAKVTDLI
jgi:hypothetical protein